MGYLRVYVDGKDVRNLLLFVCIILCERTLPNSYFLPVCKINSVIGEGEIMN